MNQEKLTSAFVYPVIHDQKFFDKISLKDNGIILPEKSSYDIDDLKMELPEITEIFQDLRNLIHKLLNCFNESLIMSISPGTEIVRLEQTNIIMQTIVVSLQKITQLYYYKFLYDLKTKLKTIKD